MRRRSFRAAREGLDAPWKEQRARERAKKIGRKRREGVGELRSGRGT